MKKVTALLILVQFGFLNLSGQEININVNASNAIETIKILKASSNSKSPQEILALTSTKGLIRHDGQFNSKINEENFVKEINDPKATTDAFRFKRIRNKLDTYDLLIQEIQNTSDDIAKRIEANLKPFIIDAQLKPIVVYVVLGGNSDGYVMDDNSFYINIQFFADDLEGMLLTMTHEVYHVIQQRLGKVDNSIMGSLPSTDIITLIYAASVYSEGSASFIADPLKIENQTEHIKFNADKYNRNLKRLEESFVLFESMLAYGSTNPNARPDLAYNIGFGGNWDSPLYFVGYEICERLEAKYGENHIKTYLNKLPTELLMDYIKMYRDDSSSAKYKFSKSTEEMITSLHKRLEDL